jgi:hypothetical protein
MIRDLVFEYSSGTKDAYNLTRQAFVEILKDAFLEIDPFTGTFPEPSSCIDCVSAGPGAAAHVHTGLTIILFKAVQYWTEIPREAA